MAWSPYTHAKMDARSFVHQITFFIPVVLFLPPKPHVHVHAHTRFLLLIFLDSMVKEASIQLLPINNRLFSSFANSCLFLPSRQTQKNEKNNRQNTKVRSSTHGEM